ncbi:hypothetical protein D3C84_1160220 [compost metagenome]
MSEHASLGKSGFKAMFRFAIEREVDHLLQARHYSQRIVELDGRLHPSAKHTHAGGITTSQ